MDFKSLKRKELQALCKEHGIKANLTNVEMANRLTALFKGKQRKGSKSCLKNLENKGVNDVVNDEDENEKVESKEGKRVRFSPQNETFEFEKTDPREWRLLARKRRALAKSEIGKDPVLVDENVSGGEDTVGGEKPKRDLRRRRSMVNSETESENLVGVNDVKKPVGRNLRRRTIVKSDAVLVSQGVNDVEKAADIEIPKRNLRRRSVVKSDEVLVSEDVGNVEKLVELKKPERSLRSRGGKAKEKDVESSMLSPCVEKKAKRVRKGQPIAEEGGADGVERRPDKKLVELKKPERSLRSRGRKAKEKDVNTSMLSPCVEKKAKRGRKGGSIVEEGGDDGVDRRPDKKMVDDIEDKVVANKRQLRSRKVTAESLSKVDDGFVGVKGVNEKSENVLKVPRRSARQTKNAKVTDDAMVSKGQGEKQESNQEVGKDHQGSSIENNKKRKRGRRKISTVKQHEPERISDDDEASDQQSVSNERPPDSNALVGSKLRGRAAVVKDLEDGNVGDIKILEEKNENVVQDGGSNAMLVDRRSTKQAKTKVDCSSSEEAVDDNVPLNTCGYTDESEDYAVQLLNQVCEANACSMEKADAVEIDILSNQVAMTTGATLDNYPPGSIQPEMEEDFEESNAGVKMTNENGQVTTGCPSNNEGSGPLLCQNGYDDENPKRQSFVRATKNTKDNAFVYGDDSANPVQVQDQEPSMSSFSGEKISNSDVKSTRNEHFEDKSVTESVILPDNAEIPLGDNDISADLKSKSDNCLVDSIEEGQEMHRLVHPRDNCVAEGSSNSNIEELHSCEPIPLKDNEVDRGNVLHSMAEGEEALPNISRLIDEAISVVLTRDRLETTDAKELLGAVSTTEMSCQDPASSPLSDINCESYEGVKGNNGVGKAEAEACPALVESQSFGGNDNGTDEIVEALQENGLIRKNKNDDSLSEQVVDINVPPCNDYIDEVENQTAPLVNLVCKAKACSMEKADIVENDIMSNKEAATGGATPHISESKKSGMKEPCHTSGGSISMEQTADKCEGATQCSPNTSQHIDVEYDTTISGDCIESNISTRKNYEKGKTKAASPARNEGPAPSLWQSSNDDDAKCCEQPTSILDIPLSLDPPATNNFQEDIISTPPGVSVGILNDTSFSSVATEDFIDRSEPVCGTIAKPTTSNSRSVSNNDGELPSVTLSESGDELRASESATTACATPNGSLSGSKKSDMEDGSEPVCSRTAISTASESRIIINSDRELSSSSMSKSGDESRDSETFVSHEGDRPCNQYKNDQFSTLENGPDESTSVSERSNDGNTAKNMLDPAAGIFDKLDDELTEEDEAIGSRVRGDGGLKEVECMVPEICDGQGLKQIHSAEKDVVACEAGSEVNVQPPVDVDGMTYSEVFIATVQKSNEEGEDAKTVTPSRNGKIRCSTSNTEANKVESQVKDEAISDFSTINSSSFVQSQVERGLNSAADIYDKVDDQLIKEDEATGSSEKSDRSFKEVKCTSPEICDGQGLNQFISAKKLVMACEASAEGNVQYPLEGSTPFSEPSVATAQKPIQEGADAETVTPSHNWKIGCGTHNTEANMVESQAKDEFKSEYSAMSPSLFVQLQDEGPLTVSGDGLTNSDESKEVEGEKAAGVTDASVSVSAKYVDSAEKQIEYLAYLTGPVEKVQGDVSSMGNENRERTSNELHEAFGEGFTCHTESLDAAEKESAQQRGTIEDARSEDLSRDGNENPENTTGGEFDKVGRGDGFTRESTLLIDVQEEANNDGAEKIMEELLMAEKKYGHVDEMGSPTCSRHLEMAVGSDNFENETDKTQGALQDTSVVRCLSSLDDSVETSEYHVSGVDEVAPTVLRTFTVPKQVTSCEGSTMVETKTDSGFIPMDELPFFDMAEYEGVSLDASGDRRLNSADCSVGERNSAVNVEDGGHGQADFDKHGEMCLDAVVPLSEAGVMGIESNMEGRGQNDDLSNDSAVSPCPPSFEDFADQLQGRNASPSTCTYPQNDSPEASANISVHCDSADDKDQKNKTQGAVQDTSVVRCLSSLDSSVLTREDNVSGVGQMAQTVLRTFPEANQANSNEGSPKNIEAVMVEAKEDSGSIPMDELPFFDMPENGVSLDTSGDRHFNSADRSVGKTSAVNVEDGGHGHVGFDEHGDMGHDAVVQFSEACVMGIESNLEGMDHNDDLSNGVAISSCPSPFEDFTDQLQGHNASPAIPSYQQNPSPRYTSQASANISACHDTIYDKDKKSNIESSIFTSWELDLIWGEMPKDEVGELSVGASKTTFSMNDDSASLHDKSINIQQQSQLVDQVTEDKGPANSSDNDPAGNKVMDSSMFKRKNSRSILIHGTPRRATLVSHDMKENTPALKTKQIVDVTAVKPLVKRKALEELRQ